MELLDRFAPFMARTLHYAGTAVGLATPIADVQDALRVLVDTERAANTVSDNKILGCNLDLCRFAVCAWADEILLNSPRLDAGNWLGLSLQSVYFHTNSAGSRFFTDLDALLCRASSPSVPSEASQPLKLTEQTLLPDSSSKSGGIALADRLTERALLPDSSSKSGGIALADRLTEKALLPDSSNKSAGLTLADRLTERALLPDSSNKSAGLTLADRLTEAAHRPLVPADKETLRVYATCLLYGFSGQFYTQPETLRALRSASGSLLTATNPVEIVQKPLSKSTLATLLHTFEPVLYVAVPLLVCAAFGLYCASILASLPVPVSLS